MDEIKKPKVLTLYLALDFTLKMSALSKIKSKTKSKILPQRNASLCISIGS